MDQGRVIIGFNPGDTWDEKSFVRTASLSAVAAMEKLFTPPDVNIVTIEADTAFTDKYGGAGTEAGFTVTMSRDVADKITWSTFKNLVLGYSKKLTAIATFYQIHPAILKNL